VLAISCGAEEVRERAESKMAELLDGDLAAAKELVGGVGLDDVEVRSRWWSAGPEAASGVAGVQQRLSDLMAQIRYSPAETVVLVGHSHLFRELLRSRIDASFSGRDPSLAASLKSKKLSNCGVARLELDFDAAPETPIVGCRLVAGTEMVK